MRKTFLLIVLLLLGQQSAASILGFQTLELNFKNQDEVSAKARWSNKDKLNITSQGIGTSLDPAVVVDTSIETLGSFAVGYSWRPIQSTNVSVEISPPRKTRSLANGQTFVPSAGSFYVRYSPDAKHWSSWQVIELNKGTQDNGGSWKFDGQNRRLKRLLRTCAERLMKRNYDGRLCPWLRRSIASPELSNLIHKFHQGPARDLFVKYDTNHLEAPVAYAIVTGISAKDKIPSELLEHLGTWIKFYEEREADGNTLEDDVSEEDEDPSNRRK